MFYIARDEEIKEGLTTDIYFVRTEQILKAKGKDKVRVVAEITAGELPKKWPWGILCGIEEVAKLLEGRKIDVYSMPEGSIFYHEDYRGIREPVMFIEGPYGEFCRFETPLLGLICQSSGIATASARIRKIIPDKLILSFGIRRMHPALSPMIDRSAYIGGFDGVSSLTGAKAIGKKPMGTMPHSLIIMFGNQVEAWKAFDEVMDPDVPRIALIDTYFDEKTEAIMAANALKDKLFGVRLDTPGSRKGDFCEIVREVRWELDARGYKNVKIIVSGGLNEENVKPLAEAGADGFGIGTYISNSPTIDFSMDIVEVEGRLVAKRGKLGGKKQVWRCQNCLTDVVKLASEQGPVCPICSNKMEPQLKPLIKDGKIVAHLPSVDEIREFVLNQIKKVDLKTVPWKKA